MASPQQPVVRQPVWPAAPAVSRILMFLAFICFLIAAIVAGTSVDLGPFWAWGMGGFAAWSLSWAVV